ncbi:MAG: hypothetical protein ACRDTC_23205 [Pseudonocardiaceae bacterium]
MGEFAGGGEGLTVAEDACGDVVADVAGHLVVERLGTGDPGALARHVASWAGLWLVGQVSLPAA